MYLEASDLVAARDLKEDETMLTCSYLLPFRRTCFSVEESAELLSYFETLARAGCEIVLIDGSPAKIFEQNALAFDGTCRHVRVDRRFGYLNDKVNGVHTGIELATCEKVILADDDIRYTPEVLRTLGDLLDDYEVVRPQNFLRPLPWWARLESARMLINRATLRAADYPGTCAFRRTTILEAGHYDGDVLFDNEEIIRHFAQHGCTIAYATDLFVKKRPPAFRKWIEQRPRQAYEDFGLRTKTALFFALIPVVVLMTLMFGVPGFVACLLALSFLSIFFAIAGRARGRARQFFPLACCFFAPFWIVERTLSTYWALYWRLTYGGYPFGARVLSRGIGRAWFSGGRAASRQIRQGQNL